MSTVPADLETIAKKLAAKEPRAAQRLRDLQVAVKGGFQADAWAACDVHRLVDPDGIVQGLKVHQATERWVSVLEWIRNGLVLAPLVMTWIGIWAAVSAYHALLAAQPDKATEPFLSLWQNGFDGYLIGDFTLGTLAAIDFSLLAALLLLTLIVSWRTHILNDRAESEAEDIRAELSDALAAASLALATRNWTQPTNFVDRFEQAANQLLAQLDAERKRLAQLTSEKEQELRDLAALTPGLDKVANKLLDAADTIQRTNDALSTSIHDLLTPASELAKLAPLAQQAVTHFRDLSKALDDIATEQATWGADLRATLDELKVVAGQETAAATRLGTLTAAQTDFLQKLANERDAQTKLAITISDATSTLEPALNKVDDCAVSLRGIAREMTDLVNRLTGLPSALQTNLFDVLKEHSRAASDISNAGAQLAGLPMTLQRTLVDSLSQQAKATSEMGAAGTALHASATVIDQAGRVLADAAMKLDKALP